MSRTVGIGAKTESTNDESNELKNLKDIITKLEKENEELKENIGKAEKELKSLRQEKKG